MSPEFPTEPGRQESYETASALSGSAVDGFLSARVLKWAERLLLTYFGARLVFLALNLSSFVPPDEITHAGLCQVFSKVFLLPDNSPESYQFGLVTNSPWLYYWLMGKLAHLNIFGLPDLVYLRLVNIPLAFGTVCYIRRTLTLFSRDRLSRLLLLVALTNTAMFTFLSASVSYDNLANLLAAMSVYYLLAFFVRRTPYLLAAALFCQLAGSLTKVTFLPLVLVLDLMLLAHEFGALRTLPAALKRYLCSSGVRDRLLALAVLLTLALNLQLYLGDYLRYGTLTPSMSDVFPPAIATQYRIVARESIFREYSEGRISYMDALIATGEIKHPGDKADTFYLLMNYENLKRNPQLWMGPLAYSKVWFDNMVGTVFGIKGHIPMLKEGGYLIPVYLVAALSLVGMIVRLKPRESGWLPPCLLASALFYAGFLFYRINYQAYLYYGAPGITLQGRYLFPVLGPVYLLCCHYLLRLSRAEAVRVALALATALLFIAYDFPWFLTHATPEWYQWLPR